jgi:ADP-ribose pyrophosphatase
MNFEVLNREVLFEGRIFNVERVEARLPDGRLNNYDLVDHGGSVTVIPFDQDGNVWFVRQYRLGALKVLLELPAGVIEKDESPEDCAHREIREETGLAAENLKLLGQMYLAPGYSTELMYVYLATGLSPNPLRADADEFLQNIAIPVEQIYDMVRNDEINDSKSLAALLLVQPYLTTKP